MVKLILLGLLAYFVGSIPNALWIGKIFKNLDIREYGSGNVGATNAARVLGKKLGLLTLLLDLLKGSIFVYIGKILNLDPLSLAIIGFLAIIGHSFSIYLKFRGGKAVATTLGVCLVLIPKVVFVLLFVFLITVFLTAYVSLASIISAIFLPICTYLLYNEKEYLIFSFIIGLLVIIRHKSNIVNLINNEEAKFSDKAKKK